MASHRLYAAWQDENRSWHTIGRLTQRGGLYEFVFTKGASVLGTMPKDLLGMNIYHSYRSPQLFSLFRNKLPSRTRPDFRQMAGWLGLSGDESEIALLEKFGLIPGSDSTLVYPEPDISSGKYVVEFFIHGLRHTGEDALRWCEVARRGARLLPLLDLQNPFDASAVAVRPEDQSTIVGYVPAFYAHDFYQILKDPNCAAAARITLLRCNQDAPPQLKLLCRFESPLPKLFVPLATDEHQPMEQPVLLAL